MSNITITASIVSRTIYENKLIGNDVSYGTASAELLLVQFSGPVGGQLWQIYIQQTADTITEPTLLAYGHQDTREFALQIPTKKVPGSSTFLPFTNEECIITVNFPDAGTAQTTVGG